MAHKLSGFALMNYPRVRTSLGIILSPAKVVLQVEILAIPLDFAQNEHVEHNTSLRGVPA
jgi:hypothetical protein